jgi:glycerol-1-phosphate dehydrogenase [NAD(P)+]
MIASGFGDMFGKFTAVADWKLAHLILNEPYDDLIANRSWRAVQDCVRRARILGENWEEDIRVLISALIESGLCMRDAGHSRPASGSEHHLSHFWEMKLLREGRPTIIHGVKVGIATLYASKYYELIKQTDQDHAISLLNKSRKPDPEAEIHTINSVYGQIAGQIKEAQAPPLNMTDETFEQIKTRIITYWGEIQKIAATVP